jgi:hypothetical protein
MHATTDSPALAEIRCRSSRRNCDIRGCYTCSFTYPHGYKLHGVSSGDLGGQEMDLARRITSISVAFALETPFSFDSDRSATRGWLCYNQCCQRKLYAFLAIFKLFTCLYLQPFRKYTNILPSKQVIIAPRSVCRVIDCIDCRQA